MLRESSVVLSTILKIICTYTLELGTPARDTIRSNRLLERDRIQRTSHRSKTSVSSWRLVLITWLRLKLPLHAERINYRCIHSFKILVCVYLYVGTGNPCAGHNRVRLSPRTRSYQASFDSLENFGFFVATGSNYMKMEWKWSIRCIVYINFQHISRASKHIGNQTPVYYY